MTDTSTKSTGTDLEPFADAIEGINSGSINFSALLAKVAKNEAPPKPPQKLPVPASITPEQRKALNHLPKIFGSVVPAQRRVLTDVEVDRLEEERKTIEVIAKMLSERKESLRTTLFNHFDCEIEAGIRSKYPDDDKAYEDALGPLERDKDGFYVFPGAVRIPSQTRQFVREVRDGAVTLDDRKLFAMAEDPDNDEITHEDWLAMTEQVRIFNENRANEHLKKKPALVAVLAKVTKRGRPSNVFPAPRAVK